MLVEQQPRDAPAEVVEIGICPAAMIVDDRKRIRRTFTFGTRPSTKRAVVTLAPGDRIDLFES